jgi:hypothetical protein
MNKQDLRVITESVAGMKGGPRDFLEKVRQELRKLETVFETVGEVPWALYLLCSHKSSPVVVRVR